MSPFQPKLPLVQVIDQVREITTACRPDAPLSVTEREFNAEKAKDPVAHAGVPNANGIAARAGVPWPKVVKSAHAADPMRSLKQHQTGKGGRLTLSLPQAFNALLVAAAHHKSESLNRSQYQEALDAMHRATGVAGDVPSALPPLNKLDGLFARRKIDWETACARAGLQAPTAPAQQVALTPDQVAELFAEQYAAVARDTVQLAAWAWARAAGVTRGRGKYSSRRWIVQHNKQRAERGLPPLELAPKDLTFENVQPLPGYGGKRSLPWTEERVLAGLTAAVGLHKGPSVLGLRDLGPLRKKYPDADIPASSTVMAQARKHKTTFTAWRLQAYERHAATIAGAQAAD